MDESLQHYPKCSESAKNWGSGREGRAGESNGGKTGTTVIEQP